MKWRMFLERRSVAGSDTVEIWECEWENQEGMQARKRFVRKVGDEQPLTSSVALASLQQAICWSYGRTLANIAVYSPQLLGHFPDSAGTDARLPCEFVDAGKFRHGAPRWWCRTHQTHWGTKADQQSVAQSLAMTCANHQQSMNYVLTPFELNVDDYDLIEVTCCLPPAISTRIITRASPTIELRLRTGAKSKTSTTQHAAISLVYEQQLGLFKNGEIARVNITPPAALDFVLALEANRAMTCISCSHCQYPHLDLGDFARKPHRKHFCANCGRDSTWSKEPIISTPLKPLHDQLCGEGRCVRASGAIDLADYPGTDYSIWATTPAVLWRSSEPQKVGIRVQVVDRTRVLVDETFAVVTLEGKRLDRERLLCAMLERTVS